MDCWKIVWVGSEKRLLPAGAILEVSRKDLDDICYGPWVYFSEYDPWESWPLCKEEEEEER